MTDAELFTRLSDLSALAITLDAEGRGDSREGHSSVEERIAIGSVVRNRLAEPRRFATSYRGVCVARAQFSCWWPFGGHANYARTVTIARSIVAGHGVPLSTADLALFDESAYLAEGIIGGQLCDRVGGATFYMTTALFQTKAPIGATGLIVVGRQTFYRLPG